MCFHPFFFFRVHLASWLKLNRKRTFEVSFFFTVIITTHVKLWTVLVLPTCLSPSYWFLRAIYYCSALYSVKQQNVCWAIEAAAHAETSVSERVVKDGRESSQKPQGFYYSVELLIRPHVNFVMKVFLCLVVFRILPQIRKKHLLVLWD